MNKQQYMKELKTRLKRLPQEDFERAISTTRNILQMQEKKMSSRRLGIWERRRKRRMR